MKDTDSCYNKYKREIWEPIHLQIRNTEMNVQIETRLAFPQEREGYRFNFYWTAHIYRQHLYCIYNNLQSCERTFLESESDNPEEPPHSISDNA